MIQSVLKNNRIGVKENETVSDMIPGGNGRNTIAIVLVYCIIFILGVSGNLLVILIIMRRMMKLKNSHISTMKLWIMNLATADLQRVCSNNNAFWRR